jgi:hypothetical protein
MNDLTDTKSRLRRDALQRLLRIARSDTGQSKRVADFLLAWWNAQNCGGWDPTDLWSVDHEIAEDMLMVLRMIAEVRQYPDSLGLAPQFEELIRNWRPRLLSEQAV